MQGALAGLQGSVAELTAQKVSLYVCCCSALALHSFLRGKACGSALPLLSALWSLPLFLFLQAALERTLGALDLSTVAPKPPAVAAIDGSRIVVRIAGTTPAPALLAVEAVEVQQECGPVTAVAPTAAVAEISRVAYEERLRLRWRSGGVGGPLSDWVPVVSGGRRELGFLLPCLRVSCRGMFCCAEWGVCESLCMMSVSRL